MPSRYDDEIWHLVPEDPGPPPAHVERFVRKLGPVDRALDLGCGDGQLSTALDAHELTLADVSQVALERARARLPGARTAQLAHDEPLPFDDGAFDLVLCVETIEHVRDVQLLLSEARRVLSVRGMLAITTPAHSRGTGLAILLRGFERQFDPLSPHIRFFTRRGLRALLDELGFDLVSLRRGAGTLLCVAQR